MSISQIIGSNTSSISQVIGVSLLNISEILGSSYSTPPSGGTYLLDVYPNASTAYSLRVLSSDWVSNPVIDVLRNSDFTTAQFTPDEITDGTLVSWVGAGNSGYVTKWYDQSGNANHVSASVYSGGPRIVISGNLVELSTGIPGLNFDGTNDHLFMKDLPETSADRTFALVAKGNGASSRDIYGVSSDFGLGDIYGYRVAMHRVYIMKPGGSATINNVTAMGTSVQLKSLIIDSTSVISHVYVNGAYDSGTSNVPSISQAWGNYRRGIGYFSTYFPGVISECIDWTVNYTSSLASIHDEINTVYSIY